MESTYLVFANDRLNPYNRPSALLSDIRINGEPVGIFKLDGNGYRLCSIAEVQRDASAAALVFDEFVTPLLASLRAD